MSNKTTREGLTMMGKGLGIGGLGVAGKYMALAGIGIGWQALAGAGIVYLTYSAGKQFIRVGKEFKNK